MADKVFGSTSLLLTVDSLSLTKGLSKAGEEVKAWAKQVDQSTQEGIKSGTSGVGAGALTALAGIAGGMAGIMSGVVSGVSSAIVYLVQLPVKMISYAYDKLRQFSHDIHDIYDQIKNEARQASQVGLTTTAFQELIAGTKSGADELTTHLTHLEKSIGELNSGSQEMVTNFRRLGLGINDFNGTTTSEQFLKVADAIQAMKSPGDQAYAALQIFGKGGAEILPMIKAGIQGNIDKARELGLVLTDEDNRAMTQISKSWAEIGTYYNSVWRQMAASFAPFMEALASSVKWTYQQILPVVKWIAEGVKEFGRFCIAIFEQIKENTAGPVNDLKNNVKGAFVEIRDFIFRVVEGIGRFIGIEFSFATNTGAEIFEKFVRRLAELSLIVLNNMRNFTVFILGSVIPAFLDLWQAGNVVGLGIGHVVKLIATSWREFTVWYLANVVPLGLTFVEAWATALRQVNPIIGAVVNSFMRMVDTVLKTWLPQLYTAIGDVFSQLAKASSKLPGLQAETKAFAEMANAAFRAGEGLKSIETPKIDIAGNDEALKNVLRWSSEFRKNIPGIIKDLNEIDFNAKFVTPMEEAIKTLASWKTSVSGWATWLKGINLDPKQIVGFWDGVFAKLRAMGKTVSEQLRNDMTRALDLRAAPLLKRDSEEAGKLIYQNTFQNDRVNGRQEDLLEKINVNGGRFLEKMDVLINTIPASFGQIGII